MDRSTDLRATHPPAGRDPAGFDRTSHRRSSASGRAIRFSLTAALALAILGLGAGTASAQPVPTGTPTISGTPWVGQKLTVTPAQWSDGGAVAVSDEWDACDPDGGCHTVGRGAAYTVAVADVGDTIDVAEAAAASDGTAYADSAPTAAVQGDSWVQLAASAAVATVGRPVTLTATVTSDAPGVSPAGTVTFTDAGAPIDGCAGEPVAATGQSASVTCAASLTAPQALLSAAFTPSVGSLITGSTSPTATLPVTRATPSIELTAAGSARAATRVRYTATVAAPPGAPAPDAEVAFLDRGRPLAACARRPLHALVATCSVTWPVPGAHRITARYLGDAQLTPATSAVASQAITPVPIRGRVAATLSWTFYFSPRYTRVVGLALAGLPRGGTVEVDCRGHGCPFAVRRWRRPGPSLNLIRELDGRRLAPGARLTVLIDHAGYVGKYYSFSVRARARPRVRIACLAPGSALPGVACTLRAARPPSPTATLVHRARRREHAPAHPTGGGAVIARISGVVSVSGR